MQGLLLIDKPQGITSFGAVAKVKWLCQTKRVGHTGTLDPMATGVLPIFIGRPTVLSKYLLEADKEYVARVRLGITTDTLDITGKVLSSCEVKTTQQELLNTTEGFLGEIYQLPPMYSAIKKDGKRLYELAREGREVLREARKVEIKRLEISDFDGNEFKMRVLCSKGTYIRSLADDIGKALGTGAVLTELRRVDTAGFKITDCVELDKLSRENVSQFIISEEKAVAHYQEVFVSEKQAVRFQNGGELSIDRLRRIENIEEGKIYRVKLGNEFLGLGKIDIFAGVLKVECLTKLTTPNNNENKE